MKFDRLNTNLSFLKKCIDNSDCSEYKITKEECSIYLDKIERGRKKLRNLQENIVAYLFIPCLLITSLLVMSYCSVINILLEWDIGIEPTLFLLGGEIPYH